MHSAVQPSRSPAHSILVKFCSAHATSHAPNFMGSAPSRITTTTIKLSSNARSRLRNQVGFEGSAAPGLGTLFQAIPAAGMVMPSSLRWTFPQDQAMLDNSFGVKISTCTDDAIPTS
eukprot:gnl/MRDRNA2_/MRDRNA2_70230_c0_seq1.p1 gnl/MRDRNA2_/MRDRNA2_70230_c0~~gnl/MRDRNA2_/MRDRNA2_70230_c0_seq1.p1  ORF type:complete len:117 (-),score=9.16 gnl/MRDRNA2_/MRDRNA2_70230_c0_seq1:53-403(-)